jgi:hypothetical protein
VFDLSWMRYFVLWGSCPKDTRRLARDCRIITPVHYTTPVQPRQYGTVPAPVALNQLSGLLLYAITAKRDQVSHSRRAVLPLPYGRGSDMITGCQLFVFC